MASATARPQSQVRLPQYVVDLAADELRTAKGERVELRPRSLAVLRLLAEHAGRLVRKDELISTVWDDVAVTEDSLTQCVADIRKAIGDEDRRVLRTVPRKGYILVPAQRAPHLTGHAPDLPSLAVMPFLSIGDDCGPLTLGTGVASEIINELARNRDLRLIGQRIDISSLRLAAPSIDPAGAARTAKRIACGSHPSAEDSLCRAQADRGFVQNHFVLRTKQPPVSCAGGSWQAQSIDSRK
jgi:DNA-binding winged helix-turn-helix (wHTH) protein